MFSCGKDKLSYKNKIDEKNEFIIVLDYLLKI